MLKVKFLNSVIFLIIQYFVFFLILAFIGNRFEHAVLDKANTSIEVIKLTVGYIFYLLLASIFLMALFSVPLYFVLRIKNGALFLLAIAIFYLAEYIVYGYLYSPSDFTLGIYNVIVGIVLLLIFFGRSLRSKFS